VAGPDPDVAPWAASAATNGAPAQHAAADPAPAIDLLDAALTIDAEAIAEGTNPGIVR
jgi:hypothetical protein